MKQGFGPVTSNMKETMSYAEAQELFTELYGVVKIGNLTFDSGRIVAELDPIAFQEFKNDVEDNEGEE